MVWFKEKVIKLGYDRIKAKVKKLSNLQKALDLEELSVVSLLISSAAFNNKRHNEADH